MMKTILKKLIRRPVRLAAAFCVICCAAAASLSVSSYSRFPSGAPEQSGSAAAENSSPTAASLKADALYLIKEYEGKVCVFRCPEESEEERLDVYVYSLPDNDRAYLKKGIYLYSGEALHSLIEDYSD